jgi:peptidoglycan/xylan/chitin deacetylase (PgdA/CDA1 family)
MSEILVLCYHAISPQWSAPLAITPDAFDRQITKLVRDGWKLATFSEVLRRPPEARTAVITFDDAFASVMRYAAPVLSRFGASATVFVPTDYVSRQAPLAWAGLGQWERTPDADELTPMSWDDLRELADRDWEIGSHTRTHPLLISLSDAAVLEELGGSREECAERLGRPVTSLAYPYGGVDDRVARCAKAAGYEGAAALAWRTGAIDPYRYPRVGVYRRDSWRRFRLKTGRWSRSRYGSMLLAQRTAHARRF